MSRCTRGPNVAAALGPRSAGAVSVLDAALVKEPTATENQQYHEDDEDGIRVHVVSLTSIAARRRIVVAPASRALWDRVADQEWRIRDVMATATVPIQLTTKCGFVGDARCLPYLEGDTLVGACLCRNAHDRQKSSRREREQGRVFPVRNFIQIGAICVQRRSAAPTRSEGSVTVRFMDDPAGGTR